MAMYDGNEMYVRIHGGLTLPFVTTVGVKQGCVLSPLLFNLFLNKLPAQYDETCDPVELNGNPLLVLMYADDCVVFSLSANGLRNAICKTVEHFTALNLAVNTLKTKVLIFNLRGQSLSDDPNHKFIINAKPLAVVSEYTYLGVKLKSSGTFAAAIEELSSKAGRAWNSLSTLLYTNKRMHIDRALRLFDSLISSIALYACELWLPFAFTKKSWESPENLLNFWEKLKCETLNQKLCRLLLSVNKKTSRLCVLGELGRYPMLITGISHTLKYTWSIQNASFESLLGDTMKEMNLLNDQGGDSWLKRVEDLYKLMNIPKLPSYYKESKVGKIFTQKLSARFDIHYLAEINKIKPDAEGNDRSKLRF